MTEEERREWQERLAQAVADTLAKRASRARFRTEHTEARKWGKRALHARKLAHFKQQEETSMSATKEDLKQQHATQPAEAKPWMPVFVFNRTDENCAVCGDVLTDNYLASITVGVNDGGPACGGCVESLGDHGPGLWQVAQGLDRIDSGVWNLPQALRITMVKTATDMLQKILEWRIGPITAEEKARFVADMAARDKMLRLPGGRCVKAAEYDAEKHGPFLP